MTSSPEFMIKKIDQTNNANQMCFFYKLYIKSCTGVGASVLNWM